MISPKKICILPTNPIGNALKRSQSEVKAGWSPLKLYNDPTRILTKPSKLNSDSKRRKRGKERKREREKDDQIKFRKGQAKDSASLMRLSPHFGTSHAFFIFFFFFFVCQQFSSIQSKIN